MLEIKNISNSKCYCSFMTIKNIRDPYQNFSAHFEEGTIYGLLGEFGDGAWGISQTISGITKEECGNISYNNFNFNPKMRLRVVQAVGQEQSCKSIKSLILKGLQNKDSILKNENLDSIVHIFNLSRNRIERRMKYTDKERFQSSIALGLLEGKKIFCLPWFFPRILDELKPLHQVIRFARDRGAIIIIPSSREQTLKLIADKIITV